MTSASGTLGQWLRFQVGDNRFALPVEAVAQVVGLGGVVSSDTPGWAGLLPLRNGTLPLADGAELFGDPATPPARGRGLVLRGRSPLGFTVDSVVGLTVGASCPLLARLGIPDLTIAALPGPDGPTLVLDAAGLWARIWSAVEIVPGGGGFQLKPLVVRVDRREVAPAQPLQTRMGRPADGVMATTAAGVTATHAGVARGAPAGVPSPTLPLRVLVFGAGLDFDLAVPLEQVLELGPVREARPLLGGPKHLAGMLEWRGRLVPLVDLPARLGRCREGEGQTLYLALAGRAARAVAVRIGAVAGQAVVPAVRRDAPDLGVPAAWVSGVARVGQRPLVILDPAALVVA